ncbi:MAG: c-type cytochrome [Acidobacteriota bacterium]
MVQLRRVSSKVLLGALLLAAVVGPACELEEGWPWVRNMFDSPSPRPQERPAHPPDGTLPTVGGELTGLVERKEVMQNPEAANDTPEARSRGEMLYKRYCAVCHGEDARGKELGEDFVSPDLTEDEYLERPDGDIYTVVVEGGLNMPHYRAELEVRDRWLVINYFRALQKAHER